MCCFQILLESKMLNSYPLQSFLTEPEKNPKKNQTKKDLLKLYLILNSKMRLAQGRGGHMTERGFGDGNWCAGAFRQPGIAQHVVDKLTSLVCTAGSSRSHGNRLGSGSGSPRASSASAAGAAPGTAWNDALGSLAAVVLLLLLGMLLLHLQQVVPTGTGRDQGHFSKGFLQLALQVTHGLCSCVSQAISPAGITPQSPVRVPLFKVHFSPRTLFE